MATQWYIARNSSKVGPYSTDQMKQMAGTGQLRHADLVLEEGKTKWLPASQVSEFFPLSSPSAAPPTPPSLPATTSTAPQPPPVSMAASPAPPSLSKAWEIANKLMEYAGKIKTLHGKLLSVMAVLPLIGPMIGDFFRPIAPFNFLIFLIALLMTAGLVVLFIKRPATLTFPLGATCVFSVVMTLGFGAWTALGAVAGGKDKGVLANNIGPLDRLQTKVVRGDSVVTEKKVEGDKLADDAQKQIETEKDAKKLLRLAFEGYPANAIKAEVIGTPKRRHGTGEEIVLECDLEISVDMQQYDTIVAKKLVPVLEKVALRKGEYFQQGKKANPIFDLDRFHLGISISGTDEKPWPVSFGTILQLEGDSPRGMLPDLPRRDEQPVLIKVNSSHSGSDERMTWKWYHVPRESMTSWDWGQLTSRIAVDIIFFDKGMAEISRDQVVIEGACIPGLALGQGNYDSATLSPYYLFKLDYFTRTVTVKRKIKFAPSELQKMSTIRCAVKNLD